MSIDRFRDSTDGVCASSRAPYAVVPSDSDPLPIIPKALYVGGGGHVALDGADGTGAVVFRNVPSGQVLDVQARIVRATGTTATDIVALA